MSLYLSRRDAIRGAMAATAALAATPYLGSLTGGLRASPIQNVPVQLSSAAALTAGASAGTSDEAATILYIKGDIVKSYSGLQSVKVQDAALASRLRSAVKARFD